MPVEISWQNIALRLLLAVAGGAVIGLNREERGHAAGLRTTLLVSLAACVAMIQANLLMNSVGKASNSFVVLDLMRLPLGILSGIGFIGGGAILRKGNLVRGVTTAATLWFVTVMGLCFGGGQIGLGLGAVALGILILSGLKYVEKNLKQHHHATLVIVAGQSPPQEADITNFIAAAGYRIQSASVTMIENAALSEMTCEVSWRSRQKHDHAFEFLKDMTRKFGLAKVDWRVAS